MVVKCPFQRVIAIRPVRILFESRPQFRAGWGRVGLCQRRRTPVRNVELGPGVTSPKNQPFRVESRSRRLRVVP
jgi:hypothetical protein